MMKLWIYENHIVELRREQLNEGWSSHFNLKMAGPVLILGNLHGDWLLLILYKWGKESSYIS